MFGQRKKELKIRIEQKNDSLYMYENMTNSLDRKIKRLEKDMSEMRNESSRLQKQNQEQSDEIVKIKKENNNLKYESNDHLSRINTQDDTISSLKNRIYMLNETFDSIYYENEMLLESMYLTEQSSGIFYVPARVNWVEPIDGSGGEYDFNFSIMCDGDFYCDYEFISVSSFGYPDEGKVYMLGLTYAYSDAGSIMNYIDSVRRLTRKELEQLKELRY